LPEILSFDLPLATFTASDVERQHLFESDTDTDCIGGLTSLAA
jgi:hypothetical protein